MERFLELVEGSMKEKSEITLQLLNEALDRLLSGSPVNTKLDGKISIKRINDEAKLVTVHRDCVDNNNSCGIG
ncbi:MAG: hypothetical protein EOM50_18095 [Erysipelotrichia bacterium]|nr:hypothetical protein [Erysipelotrichia bacterium]